MIPSRNQRRAWISGCSCSGTGAAVAVGAVGAVMGHLRSGWRVRIRDGDVSERTVCVSERNTDVSNCGVGHACLYRPAVRDGEWVRFVIRFDVVDLARFREMAEATVAVSKDEPGTVVYDWYLDEQAGTGTLYEAYASAEALQAHTSGAVFTDIAPKYLDAMRVASVDVYGEADALPRRDVLGAPTTWWGSPIAAVTSSG